MCGSAFATTTGRQHGPAQNMGISDVKLNQPNEDARRGFSSHHPGGRCSSSATGTLKISDDIEFHQEGATSKVPYEKTRWACTSD